MLGPRGIEPRRMKEGLRWRGAAEKKRFLFAFEKGLADNYVGLQASKVEARVYVVFRYGAYVWSIPERMGWKASPITVAIGPNVV